MNIRADVVAKAAAIQEAYGAPISLASHPDVIGEMTFDEIAALPGVRHAVTIRRRTDAAGRVTEEWM